MATKKWGLVAANGVEENQSQEAKHSDETGEAEHDPSRVFEDRVQVCEYVE